MTGILLKQLNINVLYLFKEMGILLFSFSVNSAAMNILVFLCFFFFLPFLTLDFPPLLREISRVELLNQRVRRTLDSLQLGAKLLSKRTVQTEKTAGPCKYH